MLRLIVAQLLARPVRALALIAGIVVATASFTVLTGAAQTGRLQTRGAVAGSRAPYDVLVRPAGSRSGVERRQQLLRPGVLSGINGGITLAQWHRIQSLPGVAVAAPIATIGYALPDLQIPIDLTSRLPVRGPALFRAQVQRVTDRGLSRAEDTSTSVWVTRQALDASRDRPGLGDAGFSPSLAYADGRRVPVCVTGWQLLARQGPFDLSLRGGGRANLECQSTAPTSKDPSGLLSAGRAGVLIPARLPFVIAAIDPASEARLDGLDRAVVGGRYLRTSDRPSRDFVPRVPVLVADQPAVDEQVAVTVKQLPASDARALQAARTPGQTRRVLARSGGRQIMRRTLSTAEIYAQFLKQLTLNSDFLPAVATYWNASPTSYAAVSGPLRPRPVRTSDDAWRDDADGGFVDPPLSARDLAFRQIKPVVGATQAQDGAVFPLIRSVGRFDAARLTAGLRDAAGLSPFFTGALTGADARSRRLLGDRSLLPNGNIAGYQTQPPLLLTNLTSLPAFAGANFTGAHGQAPISAIRVRVDGVHGVDPISRERVRQVAAAISVDRKLDVDLTLGSSTQPRQVLLPAGREGRPALTLTEQWVKKGVAVALLRAVDRKSVLLFGLILIVCGLFVANAVSAAVASRKRELAIMSCLGWPARRLFGLVITEAVLTAALAGVIGGVLALGLAPALGVAFSPARAALAVPAAALLAVLAALVPAAQAARAHPAAAVRPPAAAARTARSPRTILGLALLGALRRPARSAVAALSAAFGVAALTILLSISLSFRGTAVGTVLGDTVAVQVRSADYAAAITTILLSALAVADVLYLNLSEREAEIGVMRASGWEQHHITRLVALEGLLLGAGGAITGATIGLAVSYTITNQIPIVAATLAAAASVAIATLASIVPATLATRHDIADALRADA